MSQTYTKGHEIPTIDVSLITIALNSTPTAELILNTSSKIALEPLITTTDAIQLIVKGALVAQKAEIKTLTGNKITITDNVFNPELVVSLQGGTIVYATPGDATTAVASYTPPVSGVMIAPTLFTLRAYSAIYSSASVLTGYEVIEYPNCQGSPISLGSEDGVFRAAEYVITSAPANGQPPYVLNYIGSGSLPTV